MGWLKKGKFTEKGLKLDNLTLFTDASLHGDIVGGGFWAVYGDHQRLRGSVACTGVHKSHEAEILVAAKAIASVVSHPSVIAWMNEVKNVRLVLVSDCLAVKNAIEKGHSGKHLIDDMLGVLDLHGIALKVNHVKAHTNDTSARSYVNDWCDKIANTRRKEVRQLLSAGSKPNLGTIWSAPPPPKTKTKHTEIPTEVNYKNTGGWYPKMHDDEALKEYWDKLFDK